MSQLVTIITPTTHDRVDLNERIREIVAAQDYSNIEHLINYDDGTVGTKRNKLCEQAKGSIILHMDSDDIYSPDWVSKSVEVLLNSKSHITGLSECYFYNPFERKAWICKVHHYTPIGASLCYYKTVWDKIKFPDMRKGEDTIMCDRAKRHFSIATHNYTDGLIAMLHGYNTASHEAIARMKPIDVSIPENIINLAYNIV